MTGQRETWAALVRRQLRDKLRRPTAAEWAGMRSRQSARQLRLAAAGRVWVESEHEEGSCPTCASC